MEKAGKSFVLLGQRIWRNKWGRRFTGVALIWLILEIVAAAAVLGGVLWLR